MIIYLDDLNFFSMLAVIKNKKIKKIVVLERIKFYRKVWKCLLVIFKKIPVQAEFFAGKLKCMDGESCTFKALKIANTIAVNAAEEIINADPLLLKMNNFYKKNTIELFIAKQITTDINYWTLRALVAKALSTERNIGANREVNLYIKAPNEFNPKLILEEFKDINIKYYVLPGNANIKIIQNLFIYYLKIIKVVFDGFISKEKYKENSSSLPSVLTVQTDTIRSDRSYRGQPHWIDFDSPELNNFKLFIVQEVGLNALEEHDLKLFKNINIELIKIPLLWKSHRKYKNHGEILGIRRNRYCLINFLRIKNSCYLWRLRVATLLFQAELIGSLCLMLKIKVFINSEPYILFDSSIQLISNRIGLTTICYQYSNLGFPSNLMISSCDIFIIFSSMYTKNLSTNKISPLKFLEFGYPFDHVKNLVRYRALNNRKRLMERGVKFIICYFDERVDHTRWGAVNNADHLAEIQALVKYMIENESVGLVIKSQFNRYSPSRWYKNDELIKRANATGRYLELSNGIVGKRNDIFPVEASLIADISISHKFGATSGLEAALAGNRVILLNNAMYSASYDDIYSSADIEYCNINKALIAINKYRLHRIGNNLGDWSKIAYNFDKFNDGLASKRLMNIVNCIANI